MDETDNKKRRNLMLTSSIVLSSVFLGLEVPGVVLSTLHIPADVASWRIWVLVSLLLIYQLWRFWTDSDDIIRKSRAALQLALRVYRAKLLSKALLQHQESKSTWGVDLRVPDHVSRPLIARDLRANTLKGQEQTDLDPSLLDGVVHFTWTEINARGAGEVSTNCEYHISRIRHGVQTVRATGQAFLNAPPVQDGLVAVMLGVSALSASAYRAFWLWFTG